MQKHQLCQYKAERPVSIQFNTQSGTLMSGLANITNQMSGSEAKQTFCCKAVYWIIVLQALLWL